MWLPVYPNPGGADHAFLVDAEGEAVAVAVFRLADEDRDVIGFTGLSGCLLAQSQKSVSIDIGTGMVTIALASLLMGQVLLGKGSILKRAVGMVVGAFAFRMVYTIALRLDMPAFMLKLVSSVIVVLAIAAPYFKKQLPMLRRRMAARKEARLHAED